MKEKHIIGLLENTSFGSISAADLKLIEVHAAECDSCARAFTAARVAAAMLRERTAESFEPSAFFQTRVMAHLRERQATAEKWSWIRVWRAAGALASSMVAVVVALAVLTFVVPESLTTAELLETTSARNSYSAEEVILNPNEFADEQVSDGFVLTTLYDAAEDTVK
jgi:anti-sigma-K factor RskA